MLLFGALSLRADLDILLFAHKGYVDLKRISTYSLIRRINIRMYRTTRLSIVSIAKYLGILGVISVDAEASFPIVFLLVLCIQNVNLYPVSGLARVTYRLCHVDRYDDEDDSLDNNCCSRGFSSGNSSRSSTHSKRVESPSF